MNLTKLNTDLRVVSTVIVAGSNISRATLERLESLKRVLDLTLDWTPLIRDIGTDRKSAQAERIIAEVDPTKYNLSWIYSIPKRCISTRTISRLDLKSAFTKEAYRYLMSSFGCRMITANLLESDAFLSAKILSALRAHCLDWNTRLFEHHNSSQGIGLAVEVGDLAPFTYFYTAEEYAYGINQKTRMSVAHNQELLTYAGDNEAFENSIKLNAKGLDFVKDFTVEIIGWESKTNEEPYLTDETKATVNSLIHLALNEPRLFLQMTA